MTDESTIEIFEVNDNIVVRVPGLRASADLSKLDPALIEDFNLGSGEWFWFNRIINQSGRPGLGNKMLDKILAYCQSENYSILNQVNAYGPLNQKPWKTGTCQRVSHT